MQPQLTATRARIDQIFAIRKEFHDQTMLADEYRALTDREAILMRAFRGSR